MFNHFRARLIKASLLAVVALTLGCDGKSPSGPTPPATPAAAVAPPSITAISPNTGSTGGYTSMKITGTGFKSGATVTLGGTTVRARFDSRDVDGKTMYVETPAHEAGTVDVVVTNPGSQTGALTGGYVYASPQLFDFNGNWSGYGNNGQDIPILFTIQNNTLVSVSCDTYATLTFSPPRSVSNGEFSFSRDDGVAVSGAIVAASAAHGTINLSPCTTTTWNAARY